MLELLSEGIGCSKHVVDLTLKNCNLRTPDLKTLCPGLSSAESLNLLDLSENSLDENSGQILGKIISNHAQRRNEHVWLLGLR